MFGLAGIDIAVIVVYFAVVIAIGVWASRRIKNQEDYFLAGRKFGKFIQTFASFGQGTSADSAVGVTTTTFSNGTTGMNYIVKTTLKLMVVMAVCYRVTAEDAPGSNTERPAIVFMVAGQSNAGGCGVISPELHKQMGFDKKRPLVPGSTAKDIGLPTAAADYTHSYIWVPEKGFEPIDPKKNCRVAKLGTTMHGMEMPVVRELEKRFPENDIFVVKYGPGATNLHHQWNPDRNDGLYATWLGYYQKGMAQLRRDYPEVRVIGLYWDQGESDGIDGKHKLYDANLSKLVSAVRRDTGVPQLKIFIRKHIFNWSNIDDIIAAQEKVAAADPGVYLLDIDLGNRAKNYQEWAYSTGNGHVSSKGFLELTKRLFDGPLRDATVESFDKVGSERPAAAD